VSALKFGQESNIANQLRVIFVIFQTGNRANGGVESITNVIENFQYIKPLVITQMETSANQRWQKAGSEVSVWKFPCKINDSLLKSSFRTKWLRIRSLLTANYRIYRTVRSTGCCVIHCNDPSAFWHAAFGARAAGAKVVLNVRDIKSEGDRYGWKWQVIKHLSNCMLVLSHEMKERLIKRLSIPTPEKDKVNYIYSIVNNVDLHPVGSLEQQNIRWNLEIENNTFAIGYVATLNHKKAQLDFIKQAGKLIRDSVPNAKIYFIGDFEPNSNHYARECWEAASSFDVQNIVSFVGYKTNIADWYKALDLVIVPTRNEGLARCMIESIACGTPVVSFDVCSAREILEQNNCGIVVSKGNYTSLFYRVSELAEHQNWRRYLGQNGSRAASELFAPERIIEQYEKLYFFLSR